MVHISITSFNINLYANKTYLIDVDPLPETLLTTPKFNLLENTLTTAFVMVDWRLLTAIA